MDPAQTKLHVLINLETLDVVISPLFTNLVTYMYIVLPQIMAREFISFQQIFTPATKRDRQLYETSI